MQTLREARTAQLMTMRELAERAGVAPSTIYLIEHGRTTPTLRAIRAISAALEMKAAEIVEFSAAIEERGKRRRSPTYAAQARRVIRAPGAPEEVSHGNRVSCSHLLSGLDGHSRGRIRP